MNYFQNELYLMPLSHDEVVHGKRTILDKMWGSYEEKFAQCRTLYLYMYTHPGKKLDFMGNEFGQFREWDQERGQDFSLLEYPMHHAFYQYRRELHWRYQTEEVLYSGEYTRTNFQWVKVETPEGCVYAYIRNSGNKKLLITLNVSDVSYERLAVILFEKYNLREILNTDAVRFGGNGVENQEEIVGKKKNTLKETYEYRFRLAPYAGAMFQVILE